MNSEENLLAHYEESKRIIMDAARKHQLVLFVGAGASVASGMPTWSEAIKVVSSRLNGIESALDNTLIPQHYYNARGKKEYTNLMRSIFHYDDYLKTNAIHDCILRFKTDTIITTNYDTLIEQAAEDNNEVIEVICKDSDLPYRTGRKELIKMHGDFQNDNFVLKEDDYLSYSRNFRLIENYIKSIIGTKVVLFIGYSFNDPDVKQVFSWTKDILHGDFQRAYLIESGKPYEVNEFNYFKNFGINVIYASMVTKNAFQNDLTKNLVNVLEWLLDEPEKKGLESVYNELRVFESFDYISRKYIGNAFKHIGFFLEGNILQSWPINIDSVTKDFKTIVYCNALSTTDSDLAESILQGYIPTEEEIRLCKFVMEAVEKSAILRIDIFIGDKSIIKTKKLSIIIQHNYQDELFEASSEFNFGLIRRISEDSQTKLIESSPEEIMKQGYTYYLLYDYLSSYTCFVYAKKKFYRKKQYVQSFIAEYNQYLLAKTICIDQGISAGISGEEVIRIQDELKTIDLERTYNSLCGNGLSTDVLKNLYSFNESYTAFHDAYKKTELVRHQAKMDSIAYFGTFAFDDMRSLIIDYYRFMSMNRFCVDRFVEHTQLFKMYFNSILDSIDTPTEMRINEEPIGYVSGSIHAEELTEFDIMVAIKFIELKDLKDRLGIISSTINLNERAVEYISNVLGNCEDGFPAGIIRNDFVFWKLIVFLGYCSIPQAVFSLATKKLIELFSWKTRGVYDDIVARFIYNAHKQALTDESVSSIIREYLELELKDFLSKKDGESNYYIVRNLLFILQENGLVFDDVDFIKSSIGEGLFYRCLYVYDLLGSRTKQYIKNKNKNWKVEDEGKFEVYYGLVVNRIIGPDERYERKVIENDVGKIDTFKTPFGSTFDSHERIMHQLVDLYYKDLIIDTALFKTYLRRLNDPYYSWVVDVSDFDYKDFECEWLLRCPKSLLKRLSHHKKEKQTIQKLLIADFKSGKRNNQLMDLYLNYFV